MIFRMLQLVYMSQAASGLTRQDTGTISAYAQVRNRSDEITGVLLGDGKYFLQVLEGPKASVEDTFLRVIIDTRHNSLMLLSRRIVTAREFGVWDMALCETETDRRNIIEQVRHLIISAPENIRQSFAAWYPEQQ